MLSDQQSLSIRYAQGLGIIAVVIGHYGVMPSYVFEPYAFHMPLFFLLGGILFKKRALSNVAKGIATKHLSYLIYTSLIIATATLMLEAIFGLPEVKIFKDGFLESIEWTFKSNFHNNGYFLVAWFLFAYAIVSFLSSLMISFCNSTIALFIGLICGYLGMTYISEQFWATRYQSYNLLSQVLVGTMFYILGFYFKKAWLSIKSLYIPIITIIVVFTMKTYGVFDSMIMSWSKYPKGFLPHLVISLSFIATIMTITNNAAQNDKKLGVLAYIGSESKVIMSYHLLAFAILDVVFWHYGLYDIMKTTPEKHFKSMHYWYFYLVGGVCLPLLVSYIFSKSYKSVKKIMQLQLIKQNS